MQLFQIWTAPLLSLPYMMAMEVYLLVKTFLFFCQIPNSLVEGSSTPPKDGKFSFCGGITILELNDLMAGKVVAKFCAKFLHKELLADEGYLAGDLSASVRRAFLRLLSCYGTIVQLLTLQHPLWAHLSSYSHCFCNLKEHIFGLCTTYNGMSNHAVRL